jgi:hypothetical protein
VKAGLSHPNKFLPESARSDRATVSNNYVHVVKLLELTARKHPGTCSFVIQH